MTTESSGTTQFIKFFREDVIANRPTQPSVPPGAIELFYATDTIHLYIWDQSTLAWITVF